MTWTTTLLVLAAAALHASWNAVVKSAGDRLMCVIALSGWSSLIVTPALPFFAFPERHLWPLLGASAALHWTYTVLIALNYEKSDMSRAYPIMRGAAPLVVAVATTLFIGQHLPPLAWVGILVISTGILMLSLERGLPRDWSVVGLALLSATATAGYTIVDARGVQLSGSPVGFALWVFWLLGAPLAAWALIVRRRPFLAVLRTQSGPTFLAGAGSVASYGLALWAMTMAPIALVAALRETSALFGALIAVVWLKEKIGSARIAGTLVILAGAIVIRLS
ncbi:drug/metabolite transporter (DMT)-like permease [Phenylobacterium haematophilum]|uniref:Drug/metabolite transporter (DMT)-like permease n=1 Tax=Phenylobacterium haematophilum TaxID=98513 RepID=A0A839ZX42_9CAUL|nr:drug/metabolite transporter (DMT)-like permease [Phenylobacterium haematophilum]